MEEEATATVLAGLKEVVEHKGVFCALYSDRGSHFWLTPKAGEAVDHQRLTQVGRAMRELGVRMIPAYSPQARGRSERSFGTWQGRLPQELQLHGIKTVEAANVFLREHYIGEFNRRFQVASGQGKKEVGSFSLGLPQVSAAKFSRMGGALDPAVDVGRAYYQQQRGRGKDHRAAVRALAFKWIRILFRCWQDRVAYDENKYLAALARRGSPLSSVLTVTAASL